MNIDGYTLTEKMRKARRRFRFTATEQALFYELVAICNGEDWRDVFDCSNIELCFALNVNEKTLIKARESLINAGLIYYKSGKNKRIISSYSFVKEFKTTVTTTVNLQPIKQPIREPIRQPMIQGIRESMIQGIVQTIIN